MESDDAKSNRRKYFKSPWVLSVITLVLFALLALWVGYGRGFEPLGVVAAFYPLVVLLVSRLLLGRATLCSKPHPGAAPSIAWPSILWLMTLAYLGGSGVLYYLPSPVNQWLFSALLAVGPIVFLNSMRSGVHIRLSDLGFRRGCPFRTLGFLSVISAMYGPIIVGAWWTDAFKDLALLAWLDLLVTSTLMPALFEEIAFRGLVQDSFSAKYESRLSGLLMASLFFGIGHTFTNSGDYNDIVLGFLLCFGLQFIAGFFFGALYEVTGNLASSIALHYLWNFYVWLSSIESFSDDIRLYAATGFLIACILAVIVAAWSRIRRIPHYVGRFYCLLRGILRCIAKCVTAELKRAPERKAPA